MSSQDMQEDVHVLSSSDQSCDSFAEIAESSPLDAYTMTSPTSPPVPKPRARAMSLTQKAELERLKAELSDRDQRISNKDQEIEELKKQITQLQDLGQEKEKERREKEKLKSEVEELNDKLSLMSLKSPVEGDKPAMGKEKGAKRFDMGVIKKLEKAMQENHNLREVSEECYGITQL